MNKFDHPISRKTAGLSYAALVFEEGIYAWQQLIVVANL